MSAITTSPHEHARYLFFHRVLSVACPGFLTVPQGGMSVPPAGLAKGARCLLATAFCLLPMPYCASPPANQVALRADIVCLTYCVLSAKLVRDPKLPGREDPALFPKGSSLWGLPPSGRKAAAGSGSGSQLTGPGPAAQQPAGGPIRRQARPVQHPNQPAVAHLLRVAARS